MDPYYQDERATLYCGDSLKVLASLPDSSVDALIADPPYSSGGMMRGDRMANVKLKYVQTGSSSHESLEEFSGDSRDGFGYWFWMSVWLGESMRVIKPGGIVALFTDWRQLATTIGGIQSGGVVFRGVVPWFKPSARPVQGRFSNSCEYVVWGTNGTRSLDAVGPRAFPGFFQANSPRVREHITQKPVEVMRELVKIVPEGGVVLDPFMGSGTTGVAALLEGRKFIGVELAQHYAEIAANRIRSTDYDYQPTGDQLALGAE